ncbi:tetratricopeptide repeat protein [Reichenbachiella carrageenanivorans]|uniref:protein O-GlcNAc transferase n=1 Tax=Reichenbachiella carrageenanivorans TaxID=2979869 RepID=A0ABY6CVJ3_9BACT|nr:tetratricopeptide repeat protein [Reichenbachiella carrageenanivorans]UXX77926.1 tetratricopeptide repeat protein [Reichenbachiella carrageenanivorans]
MSALKNEQEYKRLAGLLSTDEYNLEALLSFAQLAFSLRRHEAAQKKLINYQNKYPEQGEVLFALGVNFKQIGAFKKALVYFLKVSQSKPKTKGLWINLADCYYHLNDYGKAEQSLKQGMKWSENHPVVLNRLAFLYKQTGRQKEAMALYQQLTKVAEFAAAAHFQLATLMQELNMPNQSIAHYKHHLKIRPDHADAYYGLGIAYAFMQDFERAIACYQQALKCSPDHLQSQMEISSAKATICDWGSYEADRAAFEQALVQLSMAGNVSLTRATFDINYFNLSPELHLATAKKCAEQIEQGVSRHVDKHFPPLDQLIRGENDKIKVGYLSPDFREHAVGRLLYDVYRHHDRSKFEIYAYSMIVPEESDAITEATQSGCDHFVNSQGWSAFEIAKKIRQDGIDVLVDLVGYTTYCKPAVSALKPARVQMHYLGNPDTMGASFVPYFLTDSTLVPDEDQKYYTEQLMRLKSSWVASPLPTQLPMMTRKDCHLPEDAFVYCSFNFPKKLNPETFDLWMEILREVPNSVLWIYTPLQLQKDHLTHEAKLRGIDPARIIFAGNAPYLEYLARLPLADLFLDCLHYGAGSTAANALMMGLPLLALPGKTFVSRLGSSVNVAAGMNAWNCSDKAEYLDKAKYWGTHQDELAQAKAGWSEKVKQSALCDIPRFVSDLERVYLQLVKSS